MASSFKTMYYNRYVPMPDFGHVLIVAILMLMIGVKFSDHNIMMLKMACEVIVEYLLDWAALLLPSFLPSFIHSFLEFTTFHIFSCRALPRSKEAVSFIQILLPTSPFFAWGGAAGRYLGVWQARDACPPGLTPLSDSHMCLIGMPCQTSSQLLLPLQASG